MLSVLDKILMILLVSCCIWGGMLHRLFLIEDFVYLQTLAYALTSFFLFFLVHHKVPGLRFKVSPNAFPQILKACLPFALLGFLMSVYNRMDGVMLERMLQDGKKIAGIYAQSFRLLDAFSMFAFLFPTLLLPMFSNLLGKKQEIHSLIKLSASMMFVASVSLSIPCSQFSSFIIQSIYHEGSLYSSRIFSMLILGFIPISMSYIFGTLLTAHGNLRNLNLISLVALLINFLMNITLIPAWSAMGAAVSSLVTQSFVLGAQLWTCKTVFSSPFYWHTFSKWLLFFASSLLITMTMHYCITNYAVGLLGSILCSLLIALVYQVIPLAPLIRMLREQYS
jgi:O-antigen/teichoic acid export membrane protein